MKVPVGVAVWGLGFRIFAVAIYTPTKHRRIFSQLSEGCREGHAPGAESQRKRGFRGSGF